MKLCPGPKSPESQIPFELVTLCVTGSVFVHKTIAPTGTVMVDGLNVKPMMVTVKVFGGFVAITNSESDRYNAGLRYGKYMP